MDPEASRGPARAGLRDDVNVIVTEPAWRRLVRRADMVAARAARAAGARGTVVLALGVIRREADASGRRPAQHLAHLVVHGALHLAGHDHHHPGDARRMELAEARILHRLRVPNPWKRA